MEHCGRDTGAIKVPRIVQYSFFVILALTMSITIFIPVQHEMDGLRIIMAPIDREWVDPIHILDGGSTDGSKEYLLSMGYDVFDQ